TYLWQQFDGTRFVNVSSCGDISISGGTNSSTLQLANLPLSLNGALFRLAVANTAFVSPAFSLNVHPPQIIYVKTNLANGNGTNWANAFNNLKDAIAAADDCSEIWIAAGTYFSTNAISMKNGLRIYGGFAGTETLRNQRNWTNNPAILSALTTESV